MCVRTARQPGQMEEETCAVRNQVWTGKAVTYRDPDVIPGGSIATGCEGCSRPACLFTLEVKKTKMLAKSRATSCCSTQCSTSCSTALAACSAPSAAFHPSCLWLCCPTAWWRAASPWAHQSPCQRRIMRGRFLTQQPGTHCIRECTRCACSEGAVLGVPPRRAHHSCTHRARCV